MVPVLIIGELNVDLVLSGAARLPAFGTEVIVDDFLMTLGSASAICAVGLARLGREVVFAGKVGVDPWGAYCIDVLRESGVSVQSIVRDPGAKTGVTVSLTSAHDRALVTYPGAMTAFDARDLPEATFARPGHLHVSSYFLQSGMQGTWRPILEHARAHGWSISLDPGFDPTNRWDDGLLALLPLVDVLLPNERELHGLTGAADPVEALARLENGRTITIVKLGERGGLAMVDGQAVRVAPPPFPAVDTTGAGDSFNAGFLHAWLDGAHVADALRAGVACGALSTRALGGTAAQPSRAELDACLEHTWGQQGHGR
jgi:sugar/nucleoside kinase (ribokinase family)